MVRKFPEASIHGIHKFLGDIYPEVSKCPLNPVKLIIIAEMKLFNFEHSVDVQGDISHDF